MKCRAASSWPYPPFGIRRRSPVIRRRSPAIRRQSSGGIPIVRDVILIHDVVRIHVVVLIHNDICLRAGGTGTRLGGDLRAHVIG
jgi:hypothetical protein